MSLLQHLLRGTNIKVLLFLPKYVSVLILTLKKKKKKF